MKVLQITSHYNQGGAAHIAACIHTQLLTDGINSTIAYGRGKVTNHESVIKFNKEYEVYISAFFSRFTGINGWWNHAGTNRLIKLMEKIQPDVIHIHALHGYYINFKKLWKYINAKEIPVVWTFHDCHAFVGNCGYFFECDKWMNGCGGCQHLQSYPVSQWFDFTRWMWKRKKDLFTVGDNKVIVTPSDWLTEVSKKSYFSKYPCITIRNGIDTNNIFYPRNKAAMRLKYGYGVEDKIVLGIAVGYSDPRKGAKYIIQMAKDLSSESKVILIGWEKKNNNMLQGVDNVITLPATASAGVLAEYYSMADVFVLPSLAENYATTTLEAMACGTPVVGFHVGGIPEQLAGGRGIVVELGNQEAFSNAVSDVLYNRVELLRGEKLAETIKQRNSIARMTHEYKKIYEQLLEANK